jgi:type I restriction enzyme S subunit
MTKKRNKSSWPMRRLRDVAEVVKGKKPARFVTTRSVAVVPYLEASFLRTQTEPQFIPLSDTVTLVLADDADTLILWDGANAGEIFRGQPGVVASTMARVRTLTSQLLSDFLFYFLSANSSRLRETAAGSTVPHVRAKVVDELLIPLPPLPVQERIVAILQKADEIRRKRKEALELADKILPALFLEMFGDPATNPKGWPRAQLGELIADWQNGFATGNKDVEGGIPQVRMQNITTRGWFDKTLVRTVSRHWNHERYLLHEGDVLFNNTNSPELVGKTAIFREQGEWYLSNHISRLRPIRSVSGEYLWGLLVLLWVRGTFRSMCRQWVNQASISREELLRIQVPIPPERLLRCHKEAVQQLEAVREKLLAHEAQANATFHSLLSRAFTGELTAEWEAANADWIAERQRFYEKLPHFTILSFLAEKARRGGRGPQVLITTLMKYLFLLQMEGTARYRHFYHFVPYHYGPFAKEVYADLEKLEQERLVSVQRSSDEEKILISLTDPGKAEAALAELPEDLRQDVGRIVDTYGELDHHGLLETVYAKYPAFARKSKVRRRRTES